MSLFSQEAPVLNRMAKVAGSPGASGGTSVGSAPNPIPVMNIVQVPGLAAASANQTVFVADDYYQLADVWTVFGTQSTSGTLQVEKIASGTANGSGTNLLSSAAALSGTANTPVQATLSTTTANLQLKPGDRLGLVFAGTMTGLANGQVTLYLTRWQ